MQCSKGCKETGFMKIISCKKLEDCFDGNSVYGYQFEETWTKESITRLKELGKLDYFPDFPRPFFRLVGEKGLQLKGVQGNRSCQVIYPRKDKEVIKERLENQLVKESQ